MAKLDRSDHLERLERESAILEKLLSRALTNGDIAPKVARKILKTFIRNWKD